MLQSFDRGIDGTTNCQRGCIPSQCDLQALQTLFQPGAASWRTHSFAEYHSHGGQLNYFPQRSVRSDRYKLIENLLPGEVHPDYDTTFSKLAKEAKRREIPGGLDLHAFTAQSQPEVKEAYARMRQPPRYELYDLQEDPYEFRNLVEMPEHQTRLQELSQRCKPGARRLAIRSSSPRRCDD
jgi:N-sulfoglucosamine sulfohydrolase